LVKHKMKISKFLPALILSLMAVVPIAWKCLFCKDRAFNNKKEFNILSSRHVFDKGLTPWESIGGCGAGGSGDGSSDGIMWVGDGVRGGLIDVEVLPKLSFGQNFRKFSVAPRFSTKPGATVTFGAIVPVMSTTAEVQPVSNQPSYEQTTGGMGDITLDISKAIGVYGQYSAKLAMTFPTGQYDIKRGADNSPQILPKVLQKGSGIYNLTFTFERTIDLENGIILIDAGYSYPFAFRPFAKKNEFIDTYFNDYKSLTGDRRFYYRFKPYGENDLGAFTPQSLNLSAYYGYRGIKGQVHSWGVYFGAPLGVAWIQCEKVGIYDPRPDPDHKAWNAALIYGVEMQTSSVPLFFAVSLPIHDKKNSPSHNIYDPVPFSRWDGPNWSDFRQQWTFAIGIKATLF
jgi:hypothetical protein